jgi:dTDP-glucose pyrophosphorylase
MSWKNTLIKPNATIREAIGVLDNTSLQVCLVADDENRLLGTITDGDVRRAILHEKSMDCPVCEIMHKDPHVAPEGLDREELLSRMARARVHQIPLLDDDGRIKGLAVVDDILRHAKSKDTWVVLMAGGQGSRLRPLTEETPKPLLKIGDKAILELIVENFVKQGFRQFYISVNYRAETIKTHFGDGKRWGAEIRYLQESETMGTAGSLRLIKELPETPLLVMNADLLTKVDFHRLLDYHQSHGAAATMGVREYDFQVPFGVVRLDGDSVKSIDEKPVHRFFVNAGIYLIEPDALTLALSNTKDASYLDMPDLFRHLIDEKQKTTVFPIREYWLDIGRMDDFEQAQREFSEQF